MIEIDPATLDGPASHRMLTGLFVPRPIAFVGTVSEDGVPNCAPFSFANGVSSRPPILMVAITPRRDGSPKDTLRNARRTGEFTVNIVDEALLERMHQASAPLPPDQSEFEATGLTLRPSIRIQAPGIAESPATMECRVRQIIDVEGTSASMILGDVVLYRLRDDLLEGDRVRTDHLHAVGRLGPDTYSLVDRIITLPPVR